MTFCFHSSPFAHDYAPSHIRIPIQINCLCICVYVMAKRRRRLRRLSLSLPLTDRSEAAAAALRNFFCLHFRFALSLVLLLLLLLLCFRSFFSNFLGGVVFNLFLLVVLSRLRFIENSAHKKKTTTILCLFYSNYKQQKIEAS